MIVTINAFEIRDPQWLPGQDGLEYSGYCTIRFWDYRNGEPSPGFGVNIWHHRYDREMRYETVEMTPRQPRRRRLRLRKS